MTNETYSATLAPKEIDICSEKIRAFLEGQKVAPRDITRYTLTLEEVLLKVNDAAKEKTAFTLSFGVRFFRPFITLSIEGTPYNAFAEKESEQSAAGSGILKNLGLTPDYVYSGTKNVYSFHIRKPQKNPFLPLLISVIAAITVGLLGLLLPAEIRAGIQENLLTPLNNTFLHMLDSVAGPMVFLSVAWGVYSIGDAATLKRVGKRMMISYVGTVFIFVALLGAVSLPIFRLNFSGSMGSFSGVSTVFSILLDVIPDNIISPLAEGNTLQIIFIAMIVGIAMLFLGQKANTVAQTVEQINYIVQFLIEFISKLVPFFIFIVLVNIIWSETAAVFLKVFRLFVIFLISVLVVTVALILFTAGKTKTNPLILAKKALPALLVGISTASSAATFETNLRICRKGFGIDDGITSFGIPLGMVTFKPTTGVFYACISLFFAELYGIEVSPSWMLVMIFSAGILALATPPIPGGAITSYTVLFMQLGIPIEAIAVVVTCDTLVDFISTGFDQYLLSFTLLNQSTRLGMVNLDTLKKRK